MTNIGWKCSNRKKIIKAIQKNRGKCVYLSFRFADYEKVEWLEYFEYFRWDGTKRTVGQTCRSWQPVLSQEKDKYTNIVQENSTHPKTLSDILLLSIVSFFRVTYNRSVYPNTSTRIDNYNFIIFITNKTKII